MPALLETLAKGIEKRLSLVENLLVRFEKFYLVFSGFIMGRYPRFRREERLLEIFAAVPALLTLSPIKLISALTLRRKVRSLLGGALKAIVYGGGPLPAYLDRFFAAIGVDVLEGYGLTEASPIVSVRSERAPVLGTAGRPLPSTEVRIVGDKGEVLPPGRKGEVQVRGPQVMMGYYQDAVATRQVLSPEGWLETGDGGMLTIDGNLVIAGRMKHTIVLRLRRAGGAGAHRGGDPGVTVHPAGRGGGRQPRRAGDSPGARTRKRCASSRRPAGSRGRTIASSWAARRSTDSSRKRSQSRLVNNGILFPGRQGCPNRPSALALRSGPRAHADPDQTPRGDLGDLQRRHRPTLSLLRLSHLPSDLGDARKPLPPTGPWRLRAPRVGLQLSVAAPACAPHRHRPRAGPWSARFGPAACSSSSSLAMSAPLPVPGNGAWTSAACPPAARAASPLCSSLRGGGRTLAGLAAGGARSRPPAPGRCAAGNTRSLPGKDRAAPSFTSRTRGGQVLDEVAVVGHEDHGARELREGSQEHVLGGEVQVVGRLVQDQQVSGPKEQEQQRQAAPLPAAQDRNGS